MWFTWGEYNRVIHTESLSNTCRVCNKHDLILSVIQPIFHLFWIPLFPKRKHSYVVCADCLTTYPPEIYGAENIRARTPWYSFSGLAIIACLVAFGIYAEQQETEAIAAFKETPIVNSYFIFKDSGPKTETAPYFFAKVKDIQDGIVYLEIGSYSYSRYSGASKSMDAAIKEPGKHFDERTVPILLKEFQELNILSLSKPENK